MHSNIMLCTLNIFKQERESINCMYKYSIVYIFFNRKIAYSLSFYEIIASWFTQVFPSLCEFLSSVEHRRYLHEFA